MNDKIQRINITTKKGNRLQVFYNTVNNLLVVDLINKSGTVGKELIRKTLNEESLLSHL